jgi:hypothetical protein
MLGKNRRGLVFLPLTVVISALLPEDRTVIKLFHHLEVDDDAPG